MTEKFLIWLHPQKICQMTILSIFLKLGNAENSDLAHCLKMKKTFWEYATFTIVFVFKITSKSTIMDEKDIQAPIWQGNSEES